MTRVGVRDVVEVTPRAPSMRKCKERYTSLQYKTINMGQIGETPAPQRKAPSMTGDGRDLLGFRTFYCLRLGVRDLPSSHKPSPIRRSSHKDKDGVGDGVSDTGAAAPSSRVGSGVGAAVAAEVIVLSAGVGPGVRSVTGAGVVAVLDGCLNKGRRGGAFRHQHRGKQSLQQYLQTRKDTRAYFGSIHGRTTFYTNRRF